MIAMYANLLVAIFDEWFILKFIESEQKDIFELFNNRKLDFMNKRVSGQVIPDEE